MSHRKTITSRKMRRLALTGLLVSATGCSSAGKPMTWANPFGSAQSAAPPIGVDLAAGKQASSMGMAVKSAYGKSRDAVAGLFGGSGQTTQSDDPETLAKNDPLLLQNTPASIGPEVFVANGQLWESTGNLDRALENYSKALEREPENAPALASIARLKYRQERFDQAIEFFQRAIAANPSEAGLYNDLGLTQSKLGRHDEAITSIGQSLAIAPGTSRYANNLATVLFAAGRQDEAKTTLMANNKPAVAHYNMAYLHYNANQTSQAIEELGQVLAMDPDASTDSSSQRAMRKSQELFDKLGGPATQIAKSLPQISGAASQSAEAAAQLRKDASGIAATVRDTTTGVTVKLTGGDVFQAGQARASESLAAVAEASSDAADECATAPEACEPAPATESKPGSTVAAKAVEDPAGAAPPTSGDSFNLPPEFAQPTGDAEPTKVAEQPAGPSPKR